MIVSKTPLRISFFGGGSDFPHWYSENGGAVLSTTVNKYGYINCRYRPGFFEYKHRFTYSIIEDINHTSDIKHPVIKAVLEKYKLEKGLEVSYNSDLPAQSGLGSSSSFTVGLINALCALDGIKLTKKQLLGKALEIEHNTLQECSGSQDQTAAAYGGFNFIQFSQDENISVEKVIAPHINIKELEESMLLVFTGMQRFANRIEKDKIAQIKSKYALYAAMHQMAIDGYAQLQSTNFSIAEFGKLLSESWKIKQNLSDKVSNSQIGLIHEAGMAAGALGSKLLGAGGGGFVLFLVEPDQRQQVIDKLSPLIHIPIKFEKTGSSIVIYEPNGI